jgi:hypothetical protein
MKGTISVVMIGVGRGAVGRDNSARRRLPRAGKELATNSKLLSAVWCTFHLAQLLGEPAR